MASGAVPEAGLEGQGKGGILDSKTSWSKSSGPGKYRLCPESCEWAHLATIVRIKGGKVEEFHGRELQMPARGV